MRFMEGISKCFRYNKNIQCTKVETKKWSVLKDNIANGRVRVTRENGLV